MGYISERYAYIMVSERRTPVGGETKRELMLLRRRAGGAVAIMVALLGTALLPLPAWSAANVDVSHGWLSTTDNGDGTFDVTYVLRFSNVGDVAIHDLTLQVVDAAVAAGPPPASGGRISTLEPGRDRTILWRLISSWRVDAAGGRLPLLLSGQGVTDWGERVTFDVISKGRRHRR